jgi:hypothetical protein
MLLSEHLEKLDTMTPDERQLEELLLLRLGRGA